MRAGENTLKHGYLGLTSRLRLLITARASAHEDARTALCRSPRICYDISASMISIFIFASASLKPSVTSPMRRYQIEHRRHFAAAKLIQCRRHRRPPSAWPPAKFAPSQTFTEINFDYLQISRRRPIVIVMLAIFIVEKIDAAMCHMPFQAFEHARHSKKVLIRKYFAPRAFREYRGLSGVTRFLASARQYRRSGGVSRISYRCFA